MLDKEFKYFKDHQSELVDKYNGKVVTIKGEAVIGIYDDEQSAYFEEQKRHELGTFLIQKVEPGEEAYTQIFHSRVYF